MLAITHDPGGSAGARVYHVGRRNEGLLRGADLPPMYVPPPVPLPAWATPLPGLDGWVAAGPGGEGGPPEATDEEWVLISRCEHRYVGTPCSCLRCGIKGGAKVLHRDCLACLRGGGGWRESPG